MPYEKHVQGFPDGVSLNCLRGVYIKIIRQMQKEYMDPGYKAASILLLISVAGGLITIKSDGYRCNNGFIDSYSSFYKSQQPVVENFQIMANEHVGDSYFINKAVAYLFHCGSFQAADNLTQLLPLIRREKELLNNRNDINKLEYLEKVMIALA